MTSEELEQIQTACHEWLRKPGTSDESRLTIPAGGALSRVVELKVKSLLTFDNVLITSVVDVETGVCYSKRIGKQGGPREFIDTPLDLVAAKPTAPVPRQPAALRPTQQRYQDAMKRHAETQRANEGVSPASETDSLWIEKQTSEDVSPPKFLLYANEELLGASLLERARSGGERSGRFQASENYFEYSSIFENLTEAENDWVEASVREAYGIMEAEDVEYRERFNELSAQANSLNLHLANEDGQKVEVSEVRLEDLSRYYNDHKERWLYVTLGSGTENE